MPNYSVIGKNFHNGNRVVPFSIEHIYGTKVMQENNIMMEVVAEEDEEEIKVVDIRTRRKEMTPKKRKTRSDKGVKRNASTKKD